LPESISIQLKFFVTAILENPQTWDNESDENVETKEKTSSSGPSSQTGAKLLELPFSSLEQGRPEVDKLIQDEVAIATGPISINGKILSRG